MADQFTSQFKRNYEADRDKPPPATKEWTPLKTMLVRPDDAKRMQAFRAIPSLVK